MTILVFLIGFYLGAGVIVALVSYQGLDNSARESFGEAVAWPIGLVFMLFDKWKGLR